MSVREALHAGSWYSENSEDLREELTQWIYEESENQLVDEDVRALIVPHAGYKYSGKEASKGYFHLLHKKKNKPKRVFIFGPSHRYQCEGCNLPVAKTFRTPLGDLLMDEDVFDALSSSKRFGEFSVDIDENEHSLEMHFPFIALSDPPVTVIPILVGYVTAESSQIYCQLFAPYFSDPDNFFVFSSDFCHYGACFNFTPFACETSLPIWKQIQALDTEAMEAIQSQDPNKFREHLSSTANTICGRHPIKILMQILQNLQSHMNLKFISYNQSSKCLKDDDMSVSYATAIVTSLS